MASQVKISVVQYDGTSLSINGVFDPSVTQYTCTIYAVGKEIESYNATLYNGIGPIEFEVGFEFKPYALYTVSVTPSGGKESNQLPILTASPTITELYQSDGAFVASWDRPEWQVRLVTGYTVTIYTGKPGSFTGIENFETDETSGVFKPQTFTVDKNTKYYVGIRAIGKAAAGPSTDPKLATSSSVSFNSSHYDGGTLNLSWEPSTLTKHISYQVVIWSQGRVIDILAPTIDTKVSVGLSLNPKVLYHATIQVLHNGHPDGPQTQIPIISAIPLIESVQAGDFTRIQWLTRFDSRIVGTNAIETINGTAQTPVYSNSGTTVLPTSPGITDTSFVRLQAFGAADGSISGPLSQPVQILTTVATIQALEYDGQVLKLSWDSVTAKVDLHYAIILKSSGNEIGSYESYSNSASIGIDLSSYPAFPTAEVIGVSGVSKSAPQANPTLIFNEGPDVTKVEFTGNGDEIQITYDNLNGASQYLVTLYEDNKIFYSTTVGNSGTATFTPNDPLQASSLYYLTFQGYATDSVGVEGPPKAVFAESPVIRLVEYDGSIVRVKWKNLEANDNLTYHIELTNGSGTPQKVTSSSSTKVFTPDPSFNLDDGTYYITIVAEDNGSWGKTSQSGVIGTGQISYKMIRIADGQILVTWEKFAKAGRYLARLSFEGDIIDERTLRGTELGYTYPLAVEANDNIKVDVIPIIDAATQGSNEVTLNTQPPAITAYTYDNATTTAKFQSSVGDNNFYIELSDAFKTIEDDGSHTFTGTYLQQSAFVNARICHVDNATTPTQFGLFSEPFPLFFTGPTVTKLYIDSSTNLLIVELDPISPDFSTGYSYELGNSIGTISIKQSSPIANLPSSINSGPTSIAIQAIYDQVLHPIQTSVTITTDTVSSVSANYDGSNVFVNYTEIANYTDSNYEVGLFDGGGLITSVDSKGGKATIPVSLTDAGDFTIQIRLNDGIKTGYWSAAQAIGAQAQGTIQTVVYSLSPDTLVVTVDPAGADSFNVRLVSGATIDDNPTIDAGNNTATFTKTLDPTQTYFVQAQLTTGGTSSPWTEEIQVIADAPVPNYIDFSNNVVSTAWNALNNSSVSGYKVTLAPSDGVSGVNPVITEFTSAEFDLAPQAGKDYALTYQAFGSIATGPVGSGADVITGAPTISSTSYNKKTVAAQWSSVTDATDYKLAIFEGQELIKSVLTKDTNGTLLINLDEGSTYTVKVLAQNASSSGPWSNGEPIAKFNPVVTSVVYAKPSDYTLTVDFEASSLVPPAGFGTDTPTFNGILSVDGAQVQTFDNVTIANNQTVLQLTDALDDFGRYTLTFNAEIGNFTGPHSAEVGVISGVPTLTQVSYDSTDTFTTVTWEPLVAAFVQGYEIELVQSTGNIIHKTAGTSTTFTAPVTDSNAKINIYAINEIATGLATSSPIIIEVVNIEEVWYNGEIVALAPGNTPSTPQFKAAIFEGTSIIASGVFESDTPHATLPVTLLPILTYTAAIAPLDGIAVGPWSSYPITIISSSPVITSVNYDSDDFIIDLEFSEAQNYDGPYTATVMNDGLTVQSFQRLTSDTQGNQLQLYSALSEWSSYTIELRGETDSSAGPNSDPAKIITQQPAFKAMRYDNLSNQLAVEWDALNEPGITGYLITLLDSGQVSNLTSPQRTSGTKVVFDVTLTGNKFEVNLQATSDKSVGPDNKLAVVTGSPTISAVSYDGTAVQATWNSSANLTYIFGLFAKGAGLGTLITSVKSYEGSGIIDEALSASVSYEVRVAQADGLSIGPWSSAQDVISTAPTITSTQYESSNTLTLKYVDATNYAGQYSVTLFTSTGEVQTWDNPTSNNNTIQLTPTNPLSGFSRYYLQMQAKDAASEGPESTSARVITQTVAFTSITYDDIIGDIVIDWDALIDPDVTGYSAAIYLNGQPYSTEHSVQTTGSSVTFNALLPAGNYSVVICAVGGSSTGPMAVHDILTDTISISKTAVIEGMVAGSWDDETGRESILGLFIKEELLDTIKPVGNEGGFSADLTESDHYSLRLALVEGVATGPWGPPAQLITKDPIITDVEYDGTTTTVSIVPEALNYDIELTDGIRLIASFDANDKLDKVLDANKTYFVQARYNTPDAMGPWSEPTPVIQDALELLTINSISDNELEIGWEASADPTVTAYSITVEPVAFVNASSNTFETKVPFIEVPINGSYNGQFDVQLQALGNVSTGPVTTSQSYDHVYPTVDSVHYDGKILTATWSAETGITTDEFEIEVLTYVDETAQAIVAEAMVSGSEGSIAVELDESTDYTVRVRVVDGIYTGPGNNGFPFSPKAPQLTQAEGTSGDIVVSFIATGSSYSTGYEATLYTNNVPSTISPTWNLHQDVLIIAGNTLAPQNNYALAITPSGNNFTGPESNVLQLVDSAVQNVKTVFKTDGTNSSLELSWDVFEQTFASGYNVFQVNNGTTAIPAIATASDNSITISPSPVTSGTDKGVKVQAITANTLTPLSKVAKLLVTPTTIDTIEYDSNFLTVTCTDISGTDGSVKGYKLYVKDGDRIVAEQDSSDTSFALEISLDADTTYKAVVAPTNSSSEGPDSPAVDIITASPKVKSVVVNNLLATPNVAVALTQTYAKAHVTILGGTTPATAGITAGDSVNVDITLGTNTVYTVRVRQSNPTDKIMGPWSAPIVIEQIVTEIGNIAFSNKTVDVEWDDSNPTMSSYNLFIYKNSNYSTPFASSGANQSGNSYLFSDLSPALAQPDTFEVGISVSEGIITGPVVKKPIDSLGYYLSAFETEIAPYLYRSTEIAKQDTTLQFYLAEIFTSSAFDPSTIGLETGSPFTITRNGSDSTPIEIEVDSQYWAFDVNEATRTGLIDHFNDFLIAIERTNQLQPGAIPMIRQALGRGLPLTFDESLYYNYNFNGDGIYFDLIPGMRVSFNYEIHQFISPSSGLLNGFVNSGSATYDMGSYLNSNQQDIGFNNFLSRISMQFAGNEGGAGGPIDLYESQFRQPYIRVFYPNTFPSSDGGGSLNYDENVVIVCTDSFAEMNLLTERQNFETASTGTNIAFFRGRATVIPEIKVYLNGASVYVPLGTTVRQLIDQVGGLPVLSDHGLASSNTASGETKFQASNISLLRNTMNVNGTPGASTQKIDATASEQIRLGYTEAVKYPGGYDTFDLPLLQGDALTIDRD